MLEYEFLANEEDIVNPLSPPKQAQIITEPPPRFTEMVLHIFITPSPGDQHANTLYHVPKLQILIHHSRPQFPVFTCSVCLFLAHYNLFFLLINLKSSFLTAVCP